MPDKTIKNQELACCDAKLVERKIGVRTFYIISVEMTCGDNISQCCYDKVDGLEAYNNFIKVLENFDTDD